MQEVYRGEFKLMHLRNNNTGGTILERLECTALRRAQNGLGVMGGMLSPQQENLEGIGERKVIPFG